MGEEGVLRWNVSDEGIGGVGQGVKAWREESF